MANLRTLLALALALATLSAQGLPLDATIPVPGIRYAEHILTPRTVLGVDQGTRHARPDEITTYFHLIGGLSDRVETFEHGRTPEGRPLIHAIITSPERFNDLEAVRDAQLAMFRDPALLPAARPADRPTVVWMGYGVHGNESSAHEAAMLLLYHLAAGEGKEIDRILQELVIILVPNLNPDGHARFVDWVNGQRGRQATEDPEDREHNAPWPGGRTNHYGFDLNRDWLPLAQVESQARIRLWHAWRPALQTDFHEMGGENTYFFQPGIPGRDHPSISGEVRAITAAIAKHHARALDEVGQTYYTRESFDDFYLGKGSSYPDAMGAVGILFEQGSSRGLKAKTSRGTLEYKTTIRNQVITSLSSLRGAIEQRDALYALQRAYASERGNPADRRSVYRIPLPGQRARAHALGALLLQHGFDVHTTGDALIVPRAQEKARFLAALMEPELKFEAKSFYDVSTWNLPLAFGLVVETLPEFEFSATPHFVADAAVERPALALAQCGYLIEWDALESAGLAARLLAQGLTLRVIGAPFELEGARRIPAGTLWLPIAQTMPPTAVRAALEAELSAKTSISVWPVDQGLAEAGPDLGSPSHFDLRPARIALLAGEGTDVNRTGELWHHLDVILGLEVSLIDAHRLATIDLQAYDVIAIAALERRALGAEGPAALKAFLARGGQIVAIGTAGATLIEAEVSALKIERPRIAGDATSFAQRRDTRALHDIAGAFLQVDLDATHPLALGMGHRVAVLRTGIHELVVPEGASADVVGRYAAHPVASGYVSPERAKRLAGTPALVVERVGRGRIVHALDALAFRGLARGSARWIAQAIQFRAAI